MKKVLKRIFKFIGVALLSFVVLIMLFLPRLERVPLDVDGGRNSHDEVA